jgi:hypothetical protein
MIEPTQPLNQRSPGESGAALIMALIFLLALGLVISAVATLATGSFTTSINLGQERAVEANAESAATMAIDYVRFKYSGAWDNLGNSVSPPVVPSGGTTPLNCMPADAAYEGIVTYCAMGTPAPTSGASRVVEFFACPSNVGAGTTSNPCSGEFLFTVVTFDDLPPNSAGTSNLCDSTHAITCGLGMTVDTWDVIRADN